MLMVKSGFLLTFLEDSSHFAGKASAHKALLTSFLPKPSLSNAALMGSRSFDSSSTQANVVRQQGKDRVRAGTVTTASAGKG